MQLSNSRHIQSHYNNDGDYDDDVDDDDDSGAYFDKDQNLNAGAFVGANNAPLLE